MKCQLETYEISPGNLLNISRKTIKYLQESNEINQSNSWIISSKPIKYLQDIH